MKKIINSVSVKRTQCLAGIKPTAIMLFNCPTKKEVYIIMIRLYCFIRFNKFSRSFVSAVGTWKKKYIDKMGKTWKRFHVKIKQSITDLLSRKLNQYRFNVFKLKYLQWKSFFLFCRFVERTMCGWALWIEPIKNDLN